MKKTFYLLTCALCTLLVLPAAAQVPAYVPTDGLVGWWPFNGNANDESGNGNDGVVNGAILEEDRFGNTENCFFFDGVNDVITIADNDQLRLQSGEFTISVWYKVLSYGLGNRNFIIKTDGPGSTSKWVVQKTAVVNGGPSLSFHTNGGLGSFFVNGDSAEDYSWHHITVVRQGNTTSIYEDGVLLTSSDFLQMQTSNAEIRIGADEISGGGHWHHGLLDDIAIYNRALTEQEIQNLYTGTTPPPCVSLPSNLQQGLVGYWPFCGNANDESGNGNDGVVNGATLTEDRFGNANAAYGFDGSNFITISDNDNLDLVSDFSISSWFNANSFPGNNFGGPINLIACKRNSTPSNIIDGFGGYGIWETNGAHVVSTQSFPNAGTQNYPSTDFNIQTSNWYSYTVTYNDTTDSLIYFLNGQVIFQESVPLDIQNNPYDLFLGALGSTPTYFFNGSLDDIGIWNRALTPEEVQELYTLDACTFTVYDTLTVYETVYDTVYTYETIYDTVTTYVAVTDTLLIDITLTDFEGQPSWLNTVTVFPNPASDHITIDYGNFALMAGYNTIITNAAGATVYSSAVNSQQVEIDINAWGAMGVYYMSVYDASGALVAVRHIVLE
jgi:hypothetical protein